MKFKYRLTYRNFLDYFSNKLEKKEKHAFEKKIMQDSFESEAFDGLSKLDATDFEKDMADLDLLIQDRIKEKKRRIPVWFSYAASVIILLGLCSVLYYLNQHSPQDEMIGAQMEEQIQKKESPIVKPKIKEQDSKSVDRLEMIDEDLEMEISDFDEITEEKMMIVSEDEEVEEEIVPMLKRKENKLILPVESLAIADEKSKIETEISAESMQRDLEGQNAGVEIQKSRRQKLAKKSIANNTPKSARIISGKVVDEDKMPLPGVSIVVKGTAMGVVTNFDGQFKLNASDTCQDYKLVASFVGFESKEVMSQADSSLLVILESDQVSMDEIVAVGYASSASKTERGSSSWEKAKPNQFTSISKFKVHLTKELMNENLENLQGSHKVKFTFVVEPYGSLSDIKFKGNPDSILVKEIERLLLDSGDWYPAKSGGKAVASKIRISLKLNFD